MKIKVIFKTPDVLSDYKDQFPELTYEQEKEFEKLIDQYLRYGELITIEFDIANKTASVLKANKGD